MTLSTIRLLDGAGTLVAGPDPLGSSYTNLPEVRRALRGRPVTTLRSRIDNPYSLESPPGWLSRAPTVEVYHLRPVLAGSQVIGVVMLSGSPRGLFVGIYQDRGKIALGVVLIFLTLLVLAGLLSRGIARPIRDLSRATERVARGEHDMPEALATAAVEIRDLYDHFATMAAQIDLRARYLRDFAAAVSHEFKTPLTGIRGALELIADHEMTEDERRRFLANATADAERLSLLVQRLLELARADMAPRQSGRCHLREVAEGVAVPRLTVAVTGEDEVPIDSVTLSAVLSILFENSRQAGAGSATLDLSASRDAVTIRYRDDGPGIPAGDQARIFTPFFTSRRDAGGSGLGLPIARSLLAASGGTIDTTPTVQGAEFVIGLSNPS